MTILICQTADSVFVVSTDSPLHCRLADIVLVYCTPFKVTSWTWYSSYDQSSCLVNVLYITNNPSFCQRWDHHEHKRTCTSQTRWKIKADCLPGDDRIGVQTVKVDSTFGCVLESRIFVSMALVSVTAAKYCKLCVFPYFGNILRSEMFKISSVKYFGSFIL